MSEKKLLKILKDKGVRTTKKGEICLRDFVTNIIEPTDPRNYINSVKCDKRKKIGTRIYITCSDCIDILKQARTEQSKKIYRNIQTDEEDQKDQEDEEDQEDYDECESDDDNSDEYEDSNNNNNVGNIIDVDKQIFQFDGHKFLVYFVEKKEDDGWDVWIPGTRFARYLNYSKCDQVIRDQVDENNKLNLKELLKNYTEIVPPKDLNKNTMFINLSGIFNLVHKSKKPMAIKIRRWMDNEVMPALVKYGTYTMQPRKLEFQILYDETSFSKYDAKAVLYMAYVGKIKGIHYFKFGFSRNMFRREFNEHRKNFDVFKIVFIAECDNCEKVEALFKKEIQIRNLNYTLTIRNKTQTELFAITTKYTHEFMIKLLQELIAKNPLEAIKEADSKISHLSAIVDTYKQSDDLRKLELQYKMSENYKLELEKDIKIKKMDSETQITIKKIDLEIQREKNKQIAMEQGYALDHLLNDIKTDTHYKNKNNK